MSGTGMSGTESASEPVARLDQLVACQAGEHPDALAVIHGEHRVSYQQLHVDIERCAVALQHATQPGDRIAILASNCYEYIVLLYAIPAAQRIAAPLNTRLAPAEWAEQLQRIDAAVVCGEAALLSQLPDAMIPEVSPPNLVVSHPYREW